MSTEARKFQGDYSLKQVCLPGFWRLWPYLFALFAVALMTAVIHVTHADTSLVNIPPLFMLAVQGVAMAQGSRAAIFASVVAFLCFDWFFVEPRYQFTVRDPFEFVALCVFLVTALVVGHLTASVQRRALEARRREVAASTLANASWAVAAELNMNKALAKVLEQLKFMDSIDKAAVLVPTSKGFSQVSAFGDCLMPSLATPDSHAIMMSDISIEAVEFVRSNSGRIGWDEAHHWNKALAIKNDQQPIYLPISSEGQIVAVFYLLLKPAHQLRLDERQVVESLLNHIAVVIQREKLIESLTQAQAISEADRLKTALLQMVSHDFRSPLASIKASVGTVTADEGAPIDAETLQEIMNDIEASTDRLNRMVGNILDLSRLEANAWRPQCRIFALSELIGAALDSFTESENNRISVSIGDSGTELWVDSVQIVQVFRNLIENALKYSTKNIEISAVDNKSSRTVTVEISDRGRGLPKGDEQKIFEPFYRAPEHQESSRPGLGMGLAVCKGLVVANGGAICARNRPGGGTVFSVVLPHALPSEDPKT